MQMQNSKRTINVYIDRKSPPPQKDKGLKLDSDISTRLTEGLPNHLKLTV